jgi:hypothetical protein
MPKPLRLIQQAQGRRLPKSVRKFFRQEKARLRREISDAEEAERSIKELAERIRQIAGVNTR